MYHWNLICICIHHLHKLLHFSIFLHIPQLHKKHNNTKSYCLTIFTTGHVYICTLMYLLNLEISIKGISHLPLHLKGTWITSEITREHKLLPFVSDLSPTREWPVLLWIVSWSISWYQSEEAIFICVILVKACPKPYSTVTVGWRVIHSPLEIVLRTNGCDIVGCSLFYPTTWLGVGRWYVLVDTGLRVKQN